MTTFLAAYAALRTYALFAGFTLLALLILFVLVSVDAALAQDTIAVTPTGPLPPAEVPTITLLRDGAITAALVILVAVVVWRASMLDLWMHSRLDLHGMAAALMHDEMQKRGLVSKPEPEAPSPTLADEDDPWVAEANKVAPPPTPAPRRVQSAKSAKSMAADLSPFTPRKKGAVMQ